MLDTLNQALCKYFQICSNTEQSFFWGVASSLVATLISTILVVARGAIFRSVSKVYGQLCRTIRIALGLARGTLTIREIQPTLTHDKFPAVDDLNYHPQFSRIASAIAERGAVIISGPVGSGRTGLGIAALKHIGFPTQSQSQDCTFLLIDCQEKKSAEAILDSILEGNELSVSSQEGIDKKIERLSVLSQRKYCSILLRGLEFLADLDRSMILSIPQRASTKFKFIFSALPTVNISNQHIDTISLAPLNSEQIESLCRSSSSDFLRHLSASDIRQIETKTKGSLSALKVVFRTSNNRDELLQLLSKSDEGVGIVQSSLMKSFAGMDDLERRAMVFVAKYGGRASWKLLKSVFSLSDANARSIKQLLMLSPAVLFDGDEKSGSIEFSTYASEQVTKAYGKKYQFARSGIPNRLVDFFSSFDEINGQDIRYSEFYADRSIINPFLDECSGGAEASFLFNFYRSVSELLYNRGYFEQRLQLGIKVAQLLEHRDSPQFASWVLCSAGSVATVLGQTEIARSHISHARQLAQAANSRNDVLRADRALASTYYRDGIDRFFEAANSLDNVLRDTSTRDDPTNLIDALYLKICLEMRGLQASAKSSEVAAAKDLIVRMKNECEMAKWQRGTAYALLEEARLCALLGSFKEAELIATEALAVGQDYEDARHIARCHMLLGQIKLCTSTKWLSKHFNNGIKMVRVAETEFSRLKMDNELEEARSMLEAAKKILPLKKMYFRLWFSSKPIGGD